MSGRAYVYFIGGEEGPIKIGRSRDVERRIKEMKVFSAVPLSILAVVDDAMISENEMHRSFADLRLQGEWFARDARLMNLIRLLQKEPASRWYLRKQGLEIAA